ncbi:Iron-sulfur assembly protein 1 [Tieghemiomyces parasiticus]|uniref:Iron-sulfur assembly protein 1 n=1 Tax=Tieghemiomyces parasiticus TaxID=78921 RepID=A0A9W8ABT1_9FUNG|nr:Iron-sulfur assembly protein 1 [Tieghemiomyces parasiticus]KAJ1930420.1 Iron-sulfur assembly protein 1 [Tieghemiomyces parasiticus]
MSIPATVRKGALGAKPSLRLRKAAISLTPAAVRRVQQLVPPPTLPEEKSKFLKIGVKTKGCSGLQYALDYTDKKLKFDEVVNQDGVTVLIDSKALLTILGSEMDYVEDPLASQFVFTNPNVKESCGCGMSFMI